MASAISSLGNIVIANSESSIVFAGIPNTYRDLYIQVVGKSTISDQISLVFNGDITNGNYNWTQVGADPGSGLFGVGLSTSSNIRIGLAGTSASSHFAHIIEYGQAKYKEMIARSSTADTDVRLIGGQWRSNDAISSIEVKMSSGNFVNGTTISLYGVSI